MRKAMVLLFALLATSATATGNTWISVGPPGVPALKLAVEPSGMAVAFSSGTGIWVSRDGGSSWEETPLPFVKVIDMFFDPAHPGELIALVENWPGLDGREALIVGHDLGRAWEVRWVFPEGGNAYVAAPDPWTPGAVVLAGTIGEHGVFRLDADGNIDLLLAFEGGIAAMAAIPNRALWVLPRSHAPRVSTDGGNTWTVASDPSAGSQYTIAVNPLDPEKVVVGDDVAIYVSSDGGHTWADWNIGMPVLRVVFSAADPEVVWAVAESALYRSTDGGGSWMQMPLSGGSYADVLPDPADPSGVWVAAPVPPDGVAWPGVLRSDDLGSTFHLATDGVAAMPIEEVLPSPDGFGPELVVRTPSGYMALDEDGWRMLRFPESSQIDPVARDPQDGLRLYASGLTWDQETYGDALFVSEDGGISWSKVTSLVPRAWFFELAPDPYDQDQVLAAGRFGVVAFHPKSGDWVGALTGESSADTVVFLPDQPGIVLAAGAELGAVYRSHDHGESWTLVAEPELPAWEQWCLIPATGGRVYLYVSSDEDVLLVSDDSGSTWRGSSLPASDCSPPSPTPASADNLAVACYSGNDAWGLYLSTDGGDSWRMLPGPSDSGLVASFAVWDPIESGTLWVGTARHGVWKGRVFFVSRRPHGRVFPQANP